MLTDIQLFVVNIACGKKITGDSETELHFMMIIIKGLLIICICNIFPIYCLERNV